MVRDRETQPPDENALFSEDEFTAAFALITSPEEARVLAREISSARPPDDDGGQWVLSPDLLDLLSLVSDDCAVRVRSILHLTAQEAQERRQALLRRLRDERGDD